MKNWKTTLTGIFIAIVVAVAPILQTGEIEWKNVILAAIIAAFGYFAKDHDVTGV